MSNDHLLDAIKVATRLFVEMMDGQPSYIFVLAASYTNADGGVTDVQLSSNLNPPMARDFMAHLGEASTPPNFDGLIDRSH